MPARALIVEDDTATRQAMVALLEHQGCAIDAVEDGEKAIGRLARHRYDVILLDIALPKVSGTDVMEFIASTNPEMLTCVVVVTGLPAEEIRALFPSILDALSKPVLPSRLIGAVRRCLRRAEKSGGGATSVA